MSDFIRRKIKPPKNLGELLKSARCKKNISLHQAEEETKIRVRYLKAMEENRYDLLPGSVYGLGFLSKYAEFLELKKDSLVEQFKREKGESKSISQLAPKRRMKEPWFSITPKMLIVIGVCLALFLILGYIVYSVRVFTLPPNLEISSPNAEQVIKEEKVIISGKTDEGATLKINGQTVLVDNVGNFSQQVKLNQGLNVFELSAENRLKKETTKQVKILAEF